MFRSFPYRDWEFDPSVGLAFGQYWVDGVGANVRRTGGIPLYSALETSAEAAYRLSTRFRIRTSVDWIPHMNRPKYVSDAVSFGSVWDPTGVALRASIGPELTLVSAIAVGSGVTAIINPRAAFMSAVCRRRSPRERRRGLYDQDGDRTTDADRSGGVRRCARRRVVHSVVHSRLGSARRCGLVGRAFVGVFV